MRKNNHKSVKHVRLGEFRGKITNTHPDQDTDTVGVSLKNPHGPKSAKAYSAIKSSSTKNSRVFTAIRKGKKSNINMFTAVKDKD